MCPNDNITTCNETKYYPDRSSCVHYFQCATVGSNPVRRQCAGGMVFDIDQADCIVPDSSFDCDYRCVTPAPTTVAMTTEITTNTNITRTTETVRKPHDTRMCSFLKTL